MLYVENDLSVFINVTGNIKNIIKVVATSGTLEAPNGCFIRNYFIELNLTNTFFIVVIETSTINCRGSSADKLLLLFYIH